MNETQPTMTPRLPPSRASRRLFLQHAGALSALTGAGAPLALNLLAAGSASAQGTRGYQALVCLFMFGGNDAYNMVMPTDADSWQAYVRTRNQAPDSIALLAPGVPMQAGAELASLARLGGVLPLTPRHAQGRSFALHPALGSLQTLFNSDRRLAIVPNIGPLVRPTSKAQYALATHARPINLFSHNDQQNSWQALAAEGATRGWGGRMGDALASMNSRTAFTAVSASGNAVWLSGQTVLQYQVGPGGAVRMGGDEGGRIDGSSELVTALRRVAARSRSGHVLEADIAAVAQRSIEAEAVLRGALRPAGDPAFATVPASGAYDPRDDPKLHYDNPVSGGRSFNPLAQQLQVVARMIEAGMSGATGVRRQLFFVGQGSFDTHDTQNRSHANLMAQLAQALGYFDDTLGTLSARNIVTTFTASEFGRSFTSNGDGTDHGWGGHHLVLGGAVKGGDLYGRFPVLGVKNANDNGFASSPDQLENGALLPSTSVDQLGATLGRWFGLSEPQLTDIFPSLANFDPSQRNLGFF